MEAGATRTMVKRSLSIEKGCFSLMVTVALSLAVTESTKVKNCL